ncbi:unnamed protein product [Closterium sp. Naga37s-1]|nr:unnamed protein product [Closterium sp. Naga37s-1]
MLSRLVSSSHISLAAIVPSAQDAEVVTSGENDKGARPTGAEERGSVEGTVTMAANEGREGGNGREHGEGIDGVGGGAERDNLRAKRRNRRAEKKSRKAEATESTESTESTPRGVSEWRTRPLVPHGASQWPQIQSLAATSAGASLSIDAIFAALGLPPLADGHPQLPVRVRQHVNPLKTSLMAPPPPVDWAAVYEDPSLPLVVDVGSASGRLVLALAVRDWRWRERLRGGEERGQEGEVGGGETQGVEAEANGGLERSSTSVHPSPAAAPSPSFLPSPPLNFLGFEIRDKLVQRADTWRRQLALRNAHFVVANATSALESVLATYPGPLVAVSILCPDPHFKNKHRKRRVVQRGLVEAIGRVLVPGGHVFVESDVEEVAADMYWQFADYRRGGGEGGGTILEGGDDSGRGEVGREESEGESESEGVGNATEECESAGVRSVNDSECVPRFIPSNFVAAGGVSWEEGEGSVWQELASGERAEEGNAGEGVAGEGSAGEGVAGEGSAEEGRVGAGVRWLDYNPLGMPSEREVVVLLQGSPMYPRPLPLPVASPPPPLPLPVASPPLPLPVASPPLLLPVAFASPSPARRVASLPPARRVASPPPARRVRPPFPCPSRRLPSSCPSGSPPLPLPVASPPFPLPVASPSHPRPCPTVAPSSPPLLTVAPSSPPLPTVTHPPPRPLLTSCALPPSPPCPRPHLGSRLRVSPFPPAIGTSPNPTTALRAGP